MKINGKVIKIKPQESGEGANGTWVKRVFVIETMGEYSKKIAFTLFGGERVKWADDLKLGQVVSVSFDVESRAYEKQGIEFYATDCRCYGINPVS